MEGQGILLNFIQWKSLFDVRAADPKYCVKQTNYVPAIIIGALAAIGITAGLAANTKNKKDVS